METTILYGNGVNLLESRGNSWNEILKQISEKKLLPPIKSNSLKYEYIVLPQKENVDAKLVSSDGYYLKTSDGLYLTVQVNSEDNMKRNLCLTLRDNPHSYYYDKLKELNADNYLTTNYEIFLPRAFGERIELKDSNSLLYKHRLYEEGERRITFWNIHGDTEDSKKIILGFNDYCNYMVEINDYLHNKIGNSQVSWIHLLYNTTVHIIGFGMGEEEMDIWNILTYRMRIKRKKEDAYNNEIFFYAIQDDSYDPGKKELLKAMGVNVVDIEFDWSDDAYKKAYDNIYSMILQKKNKQSQ